ncbi:MAG: LysR family transcriptional regulator [Frankia sp.]
MIDVRRLRILRELDQRGTVAAAAGALHLTPSAVSQQLATLARETGVTLLDPDGRRLRLTAAARVLLGHADEVFAQLERAQADLDAFAEGEVGTVRIAAFPTATVGIVVPALRALRETHPRLDLTINDALVPECYDQLSSGELDVAVTVRDTRTAALPRFRQVHLLDDPLDLVVPRDHPLARSTSVTLDALADEIFVGGTDEMPCHQIVLTACAAAGFAPKVRHRSDDYAALFGLIGAGCGVGLIPRLSGLSSTDEAVVRPLSDPTPPTRRLYATLRQGSQTAPHIAAVVDAISEVGRRLTQPALVTAD